VVPPPRCRRGDRVAIVSPSSALPAVFPHVHELGLQRLREVFGLEPVEYPTTRAWGASPMDRARDINEAFADPSIAAVMTTIGGDDQLTVLPFLDADVIAANPKPFFGYSDNTNLLNYLVRLGMVAYHGGSTMVHLGRGHCLHPTTASSLTAALNGDAFEHSAAPRYSDHPGDWSDPMNLSREPPSRVAQPWQWHGRSERVEGRVWGGCLEILDWTMQVGIHMSAPDYYRGCILFIETSEEIPSATYVYRILRNMGERGILSEVAGVMLARPAAEPLEAIVDDDAVAHHVEDQRAAVIRALDEYNRGVPVVLGIEAGHTDPQVIVPIGGTAALDPLADRVTFQY
jgi:muramoyltetrapeptide carboxypeptidase LdcA involved in peptidoglycan recycling